MIGSPDWLTKDGNGALRHIRGALVPFPHQRAEAPSHVGLNLIQTMRPSPLDVRSLFPWPAVDDQDGQADCTAWAAEIILAFLSKFSTRYSEAWIWNHTRMVEGTSLAENTGCILADVFQRVLVKGAVKRDDYPNTDANMVTAPPPEVDAKAVDPETLYFTLPDELTIYACLRAGFPVAACLPVFENMLSAECASTGDVQDPEPGEMNKGGHASTIVAFNDKLRYVWRNQWSAGWGQGGYFTTSREFVQKYVFDAWTMRSKG